MSLFQIDKLSEKLRKDGFLVLSDLLKENELDLYRSLYEDFMSGKLVKLDSTRHRHDLGSHEERKNDKFENITQIMWPSLYMENGSKPIKSIEESPLHQVASKLAKGLLGEDMDFDFDMLISKEQKSDTVTPWHSDEAYWLDLPDKRSLSFWFPMQDVNVSNGCMWFVPGSHLQPLRKHRPTKEGQHVLMTDECSNEEGLPQPLKAGGCTIHTGRTLHYTGGNLSNHPRRAYIVNFRPREMIEFERSHNYDHGKKGISASMLAKTRTHLKQDTTDNEL